MYFPTTYFYCSIHGYRGESPCAACGSRQALSISMPTFSFQPSDRTKAFLKARIPELRRSWHNALLEDRYEDAVAASCAIDAYQELARHLYGDDIPE